MGLSQKEIEKRISDSYELPNNVLETVLEPMVTVRTSTYQHCSFIKDCIEGVLMQETDFPIEFIIGEDFSTDGTREIVLEYAEKYPEIIRVFTADYNVGSKANGLRCIRSARGKYMALCEGDDYWTDPLKLQKQIEYMEKNSNCSMTTHSALVSLELNLSNEIIKPYDKDAILPSKALISRNIRSLPTASKVFRTDIVKEMPDWLFSAPVGDHYLMLLAITEGYVYYFDTSMSVYRRSANSWSGRPKKLDWFINHHRKHMNSLNLFNIDTNGEYVDSVNDFKKLKDMELYQGVIKNGVLDSFKKRKKYLIENLKSKAPKFFINLSFYWLKKMVGKFYNK